MIPKNIDKYAILAAIAQIDSEGIPSSRLSRSYHIQYNGNLYPPKYVVSLANSIKNKKELPPYEFGGGVETNSFLSALGFIIVDNRGLNIKDRKERKPFARPNEHATITTKTHTRAVPVKVNMAIEPQHEDSPIAIPKEHTDPVLRYEHENIEKLEKQLSVVTVTLACRQKDAPEYRYRMDLLKQVTKKCADNDVILFPAGFFEYDYIHSITHDRLFESITKHLKDISSQAVVCFGIDADEGKDQLAFALDQSGLLAVGKKFHPTDDEEGYIRPAASFDGKEMGYTRFFEKNGRKFYLAVCYDGFGIRHRNIPNPGVDAVLILAHQFNQRGEGPSGDVDFARKGFAGASMQWHCPAFGTAVFFNREIPENWPTGVLWYGEGQSVKAFKYQDNTMHWVKKQIISTHFEDALCYQYFI